MARFNRVKINDLYLTSTGLVGGKPCELSIPNLDALEIEYAGNTVKAADNFPHDFITEFDGRGIDLPIIVSYFPQAILGSLKTLFAASIVGDDDLLVLITGGDLGDFSVDARPTFAPDGRTKPIQTAGEFSGGIIRTVTINLTVREIN